MKMIFKSRKFQIAVLIVAIVGVLVFVFRGEISALYSKFYLRLPQQVETGIGNVVQKVGERIETPPPLTSSDQAGNSFLTKEGVIQLTNEQRIQNGLPPLKENADLDVSAAAKAADMFKNQYFAHESPSGVGVADLAQEAGYNFIVIGENLAMGDFANDQALISAWMASPGHRANILNKDYQDIGVAVEEGTYQGKTVWMAVQHFGEPLSACPQPSVTLKAQIDSDNAQISNLQNSLTSLRQEIQNTWPTDRQKYNQEVDQYNQLVSQYNNLVSETKNLVNQYNSEVSSFNSCASGQ